MKFNPHYLEQIYDQLGQPAYYWPTVMVILFCILPLLASTWE